jgi:hypothetical protein
MITNTDALIAEFMGFELQNNPNTRWYNQYFAEPNGVWGNRLEVLHFSTSWDWLMKVVEKIERIPSYDKDRFSTIVTIGNKECRIQSGRYNMNEKRDGYADIYFGMENSKIEAVYKAVIKYIEWDNKNNKK